MYLYLHFLLFVRLYVAAVIDRRRWKHFLVCAHKSQSSKAASEKKLTLSLSTPCLL